MSACRFAPSPCLLNRPAIEDMAVWYPRRKPLKTKRLTKDKQSNACVFPNPACQFQHTGKNLRLSRSKLLARSRVFPLIRATFSGLNKPLARASRLGLSGPSPLAYLGERMFSLSRNVRVHEVQRKETFFSGCNLFNLRSTRVRRKPLRNRRSVLFACAIANRRWLRIAKRWRLRRLYWRWQCSHIAQLR